MKKNFWLLVACNLLFVIAFSQNPLAKQWDYRFGGTNNEVLFSLQQTSDGGYILGGQSLSDSSGDKTQASWGGLDYWILKTDSFGNKQWDKRFGGTDYDYFSSLQQTIDGGYILGGYSNSGVSGDKTQPTWGDYDYWIVKIDSIGNKQWDKRFGGNSFDGLYSLQQTMDGGYILGGYSQSDSSGDKTQNNWGTFSYPDYWVVKIDSIGNKQWDRRFGGTGADLFTSLDQTGDGGYVLGGISASTQVGGDKTQPNWGGYDYWIIKIDSVGSKQWDKRFGGTMYDRLYSLQQTYDDGFILAGLSESGIGGDKTQPTWGYNDYWIVKIDSVGSKQWDKRFGGIYEEDEFGNVALTSDGGFLVAGASYSPISGDKTENNLGFEQSWIVKTDSVGNKHWDKTIFTLTPVDDEIGYAFQSSDGCFIIANFTEAGIGGYKTQPGWGANDYWFVKFCDTTITSTTQSAIQNPQSAITIFPNPANEYSVISGQFKAGDEIRITDVLGKILFTKTIAAPAVNYKLQTANFSPGIYFVTLQGEKETVTKKVVIQH